LLCVQIDAYNFHLGLLRPSLFLVGFQKSTRVVARPTYLCHQSSLGYFVPVGLIYDIEEAMKWYGDMLNVVKLMDTATGQPLPYPTSNDTSIVGERIGEGQPGLHAGH